MYHRSFLILLSLLLSIAAHAGEPNGTKAKPATDNYAIIKTADQFIIGGIGVAGTTSAEEIAFRQLLKEPEPRVRCQNLLTDATIAGQFYGLLGLKLLDQEAFQKALPRYRDSKTVIHSIGGCIPFDITAAQLAKEIESGRYK